MLLYEIWSLGRRPYSSLQSQAVSVCVHQLGFTTLTFGSVRQLWLVDMLVTLHDMLCAVCSLAVVVLVDVCVQRL